MAGGKGKEDVPSFTIGPREVWTKSSCTRGKWGAFRGRLDEGAEQERGTSG